MRVWTYGMLTAGAVFCLLLGAAPRLARAEEHRDYGDRDDYRSEHRYAEPVVDRAMEDLQRLSWNGRVDSKHFETAMSNLARFEDRLREGVFDNSRLDRAIGNMQRVANSNRISFRDRRVLEEDLAGLRNFRATRGYVAPPYQRERRGW